MNPERRYWVENGRKHFWCKRCELWLPETAFYRSRNKCGVCTLCKTCHVARAEERRRFYMPERKRCRTGNHIDKSQRAHCHRCGKKKAA